VRPVPRPPTVELHLIARTCAVVDTVIPQRVDQDAERARGKAIVGVEKPNQRCASTVQTDVAGATEPPVSHSVDLESRILVGETTEDLGAAIGRAVVDGDDLPLRHLLIGDGSKKGLEPGRHLKNGNHERNHRKARDAWAHF
jgi:hypothetical protein